MPFEWRLSTLIPLYKNKGDAQIRTNYHGLKLMNHIIKLSERINKQKIKT